MKKKKALLHGTFVLPAEIRRHLKRVLPQNWKSLPLLVSLPFFRHPDWIRFPQEYFSEKEKEKKKITENISRDKRRHGIPQNWSEYDPALCAFGFLTVFNFMHVINFCCAAVRQICISYFESETGIKDGINTFLCVQLVFVSLLLCWHTYLFIYLDVCNSFHFHFTWLVKTTISPVLGNNFVILSNNNFDIILNGLLHHHFILLIMQSGSVKKKRQIS